MTQVLVVGGGPVGLLMASELLRHGITCRVVDERAEPPPWSKAAAVMPRTLEVLRDAGVADALLARGRKMYGLNIMDGKRRLAHIEIHLEGTPYPFLLGISQRETELLLAEHLRSLGGRLERPVRATSITASGDKVRATLERDGVSEEIEVDYLVGCDGAHSTVRKALDLRFEGSTFEQHIWQADVRIDWPFESDPQEAYGFPSDAGPMGALPLFADGRYRLIALAPPHPEREPTLEGIQEIAAERLPAGTTIHDPDWIAAFRFHGRLVERYRVGRIFLAGDAAHIHSPVGAQGMNTGLQDAYNLAWKLALVVKGASPAALLDSYERERRPIAHSVVTRTDVVTKGMMRGLSLRHPLAAVLRRQAIAMVMDFGLVQSQVVLGLTQVRVGYPDSPIVGQHQSSVWTAELGARVDERPGIGDMLRFGDGPGPGERVPDADLPEGAPAATLHQLLLGTKHQLLLFDGAAATSEGYARLDSIAERIARRYGEHIDAVVVVPRPDRPAELRFGGRIVLDEGALLHTVFGATSEALYLVRPDGYVGFRSQPADPDALFRYLETIFRN